jgi:hypothetical protein
VSLFKKAFNQELVNEVTTWNTGIMPIHYTPKLRIFKPTNPSKPKERHRKVIKDPKFRKHSQTVPDMHKADPTSISAIINFPGKKLSEDEIKQICSKFGISRLNTGAPKNLGNTGKVMVFSPEVQGYIIK